MRQLYFNRKRVLTEAKGTGTYGYFGFTWRDTLGIIGYFVGQIVLSMLFMVVVLLFNYRAITGNNNFIKEMGSNTLILFGPFLIIGLGLFLLYWRELKQDASDFWRNKWRILITGLLIWLVGMIFIFGYSTLMEFIFGVGEKTSENQQILNEVFWKNKLIFGCFSIVIIPFVEEVVFRKILFTHFGNSVNYIISSIVSVLSFGLIHLTSEIMLGDWRSFIVITPIYLAISVAITCANYKTKNFFGGYFVHVLHNAVVTTVMVVTMNM